MTYSTAEIWIIIIGLGIGTYLIRFSFLGPLGQREMPAWVLRMLRYTPVAVLPGMVAPMVLWPAATGGEPEPARILAALVALIVGMRTKSVVAALLGGGGTLAAALFLLN